MGRNTSSAFSSPEMVAGDMAIESEEEVAETRSVAADDHVGRENGEAKAPITLATKPAVAPICSPSENDGRILRTDSLTDPHARANGRGRIPLPSEVGLASGGSNRS